MGDISRSILETNRPTKTQVAKKQPPKKQNETPKPSTQQSTGAKNIQVFRQKQITLCHRGHTCFKVSVSYDDARHLSLFVTTCESDVVTPETKKCNPLIHAILFKV